LVEQVDLATSSLDLMSFVEEPNMPQIFLILILSLFSSVPAHAHWGHVGELAGHGHLLRIGALAAAAALAAALAKPKAKDDEESETEAEAEEEPA
jgi:hypothetical protein